MSKKWRYFLFENDGILLFFLYFFELQDFLNISCGTSENNLHVFLNALDHLVLRRMRTTPPNLIISWIIHRSNTWYLDSLISVTEVCEIRNDLSFPLLKIEGKNLSSSSSTFARKIDGFPCRVIPHLALATLCDLRSLCPLCTQPLCWEGNSCPPCIIPHQLPRSTTKPRLLMGTAS